MLADLSWHVWLSWQLKQATGLWIAPAMWPLVASELAVMAALFGIWIVKKP